jgi:membrane-associated phospholipid phosphatase
MWYLLFCFAAGICAQSGDSLLNRSEKTCPKAVTVGLAPTLLIGAGIATREDRGCYSSYDAAACIQENHPDFHTNADDYLIFLPALAVYGLNWAGVNGKNTFTDRSLLYLSSLTLSIAVSTLIKHTAGVARPDGSDTKSMPSNHAVLAFASATFLHEEYKHRSLWYGIAGYSIATATGVLRMLNNEHWMSDVLVGAGLGILMTKTVYWVCPLLTDRLRGSGKKSSTKISLAPYASPGPSGTPGHYGLNITYSLH